jgi:predicted acyltransferase
MILGLLAGGVLREHRPPWSKVGMLALAGIIAAAVGWGLGAAGLGPVVKRIWTPSWTLYSGGLCFLALAGFHAVMDVIGLKSWAFPLRVIGMNSIAAYCLAHLIEDFVVGSFRTHLGSDVFQIFGTPYEPLMQGIATLSILWLILFWMYRRRLFLKV